MVETLDVFTELVVARVHHSSGAMRAVDSGGLVVGLVVGGVAVAKNTEQRAKSGHITDNHADTVLCESPDDHVCDCVEEVGLAGEGDGVLQSHAG